MYRLHVPLLAVVLSSTVVNAQGTANDYLRADSLSARVRGKLVNAVTQTNWIGKTHFVWYQKTTPAGNAYMLVNAESAEKAPAFDHSRLAATLSTTLKR